MKKIIAALMSFVTVASTVSLGVHALFEPMSAEELNGALTYEGGESDGGAGLVYAWDFGGIGTEDRTYENDVADEVKKALNNGRATYTINSRVDELGIQNLLEVGTFKQKYTNRSFVLYTFSDAESAESAFPQIKESAGDEYVLLYKKYILHGDERLIGSTVQTAVNGAVKSGSYASNGETVFGDMFASAGIGDTSYMSFKTPDSAIRLENGELIFGKVCKDDGAESYESIDAYMDVAVNDFNYDKAHDVIGGKSFVLTATLRAPQTDYSITGGTMELFRTRTVFTPEGGVRTVIDTSLAKYSIYTREILLCSEGETIKTGIFLSDYSETTVAVHVHPTENTFDFYVDGILIATGLEFLPSADASKIAAANGAAPSGDTADYTLTMVRLFYANYKTLSDDALCISDFAWYFSEEYLDRSEHPETFAVRSAEIGDRLYFNLYLNFPRSITGMGGSALNIDIGGSATEVYGEIVDGGALDGLVKYRIGIDFKDLTKEITVTLAFEDSENMYFYYSDGDGDTGFLAKTEYKTSALDYFRYLLEEENGYGEDVRAVARAILNVGAYAQKKYGGFVTVPDGELANFGYAYTGDELGAVDFDAMCASIDSEIYKETARIGAVSNLTVTSVSLVFDGGAYVSVKYRYVGMRELSVNGKVPTESADGKYEYKIKIGNPLNADGVYTLAFDDGEDTCIMKIPPLYVAATAIKSNGDSTNAQYIKALYLCMLAAEDYARGTAEKTI